MENDYFNQRLGCAAPKCWSKYTTTHLLVCVGHRILTLFNNYTFMNNSWLRVYNFLVSWFRVILPAFIDGCRGIYSYSSHLLPEEGPFMV